MYTTYLEPDAETKRRIAEDVLDLLAKTRDARLTLTELKRELRQGRNAELDLASGRRWTLRGRGHAETFLLHTLREAGFTIEETSRGTYVTL